MKAKRVIGWALMAFAVGSLAYLAAAELVTRDVPDAPAAELPDDGVVVYYFYNNVRCETCKKIEAYTREAVADLQAAGAPEGSVVFRAVNTDEPGQGHWMDDYDLSTKAVVVSARRGGREVTWRNLHEIWDRVYDKASFVGYIQEGVRARAAAARELGAVGEPAPAGAGDR